MITYKYNYRSREKSRRFRPAVESFESRELMSYAALFSAINRTPELTQAAFSNAAAQSAITSQVHQNVTSMQVGPHGITPFATAIQYALNTLYPTGTPQPTPHEVVRQTFVVKLTGEYIVGPPRFNDQSFQISFKSQGMSNQSFHIWSLMSTFFPKDLSQGTITGLMTIHPKNEDVTNSLSEIDLVGDPNYLFHGLPTHFTWTSDTASSGVYFPNNGPPTVGNGTGAGTMDIHYTPGGALRQRATGGGRVAIVLQGLINTSGVTGSLGSPASH